MRTMRRMLLLCTSLLLACSARADFQMFPSSYLYPHYIADPRRPELGVTILGYPDPKIPDSGDRRVGLKLGGRFGLLGFEHEAPGSLSSRLGWYAALGLWLAP